MGPESNMIGAIMRDAETDIQPKTSYLIMETEAGVMAVTSEGMPRFA